MLLGRDIAQHGRAVPSNHRRADGRRDVVVARGDISNQRAQRVERGFVAKLDFFLDLLFDFVHRDVAGAFDHHLHVVLPGNLRQLAQSFQFGELSFIACIGHASGSQAVSQRKADVILFENLADVVEALVQKILLVVVSHPLREDGSAPAHNPGNALRNQRQILDQHAGVNRHVVDALRRLLFNYFEHYFSVQVFHALHARDGFIDRHGTDGNRRIPQNGLANFVDVAASGKIHHRVGAVMHGGVQLLQFLVNFRRDRRVADVGVDLT